ncbi:MAG: site-2 protease family protein [Actinomycetota bacterium]
MDPVAGLGVLIGFVAGLSLHDYAHSLAATALGDRTPRLMRRRTLDLRAHADPLGTIILPGIFAIAAAFGSPLSPMFGWGKRHALNPRALRHPSRDVVIVALAGPGATLLLAFLAISLVRIVGCGPGGRVLAWGALALVFLTVIEVLPIPGRDGGRILARFLPSHAAIRMEELIQYEVLFLLGLYMFLRGVVNGIADQVIRSLGGLSC